MIEPTVGRIVWYRARPNEGIPSFPDQPLAAIVTAVHGFTAVNLAVLGADGSGPYARTSVHLVQDEGLVVMPGQCTWMPYQRGQAAKSDALQAQTARFEPYVIGSDTPNPVYVPPAQDPEKGADPVNPAPSAAEIAAQEQPKNEQPAEPQAQA